MMVLMLVVGGVSAMNESITVQAEPGNYVDIRIWPTEGGAMINNKGGLADDDGLFATTFFSLNEVNYKLQIVVTAGRDRVRDASFENQVIDNPLFVNCVGECVISVDARVVEEVVVADVVEEVENISVVEEVVVEEVVVEENVSDVEEVGDAVADDDSGDSKFTGFVSKGFGAVKGNVYVSVGLIVFVAGLFVFFIVKRAYRSGASAELKALGRLELDRNLDKLDG